MRSILFYHILKVKVLLNYIFSSMNGGATPLLNLDIHYNDLIILCFGDRFD